MKRGQKTDKGWYDLFFNLTTTKTEAGQDMRTEYDEGKTDKHKHTQHDVSTMRLNDTVQSLRNRDIAL